jgi:dephospho-CoA kinase
MTASTCRLLVGLLLLTLLVPASGAPPPRKQVVVMVGLPGAGKTELAKELSRITGAPRLTCGDVVRGWIRDQGLPYTPENDKLASQHFAKTPGEIARRLAVQIAASPQRLCIVDGVRSPADLKVLRSEFDVRVVALKAPARVRYQRMLARGRFEGENVEYYRQRDRREIGLGVLHVLRRPFVRLDATIPLEQLPSQARWLASELERSFH